VNGLSAVESCKTAFSASSGTLRLMAARLSGSCWMLSEGLIAWWEKDARWWGFHGAYGAHVVAGGPVALTPDKAYRALTFTLPSRQHARDLL
jgi:hypothetical protein